MINERVQRSISCDNPDCVNAQRSNGTEAFTFWMNDSSTQFPDWIQNLRAVTVDNGTPQGEKLTYCSKACEIAGAEKGLHEPRRQKQVEVAQPGQVEHVAKAAAATKNMKDGKAGKISVVPG